MTDREKKQREILNIYKESILRARDLYLDTNKPENAHISYADQAISELSKLDAMPKEVEPKEGVDGELVYNAKNLYLKMREFALEQSTAKDYITNYMDTMLKYIAKRLFELNIRKVVSQISINQL